MIQQSRRGFLTGVGAIIAAPAIVRASSLMPVKVMGDPWRQMTSLEVLADFDAALRQMNAHVYRRYFPDAPGVRWVTPAASFIDPVRQ